MTTTDGSPLTQLDQPTAKTTTYTVLYQLTASETQIGKAAPATVDEGAKAFALPPGDGAWRILDVRSAKSRAEARRGAITAPMSLAEFLVRVVRVGGRLALEAVPNFDPQPVKLEEPPPPKVLVG